MVKYVAIAGYEWLAAVTIVIIAILAISTNIRITKLQDQISHNTVELSKLQNMEVSSRTELKNYNQELDSISEKFNNIKVDCPDEVTDAMFIEAARERYMNVNSWSEDKDCSVLTTQFTMLLKEFGLDMYKVYSWNEERTVGHAKNCIPFDVQVGFVNDTWDKYQLVTTNKKVSYDG